MTDLIERYLNRAEFHDKMLGKTGGKVRLDHLKLREFYLHLAEREEKDGPRSKAR